MVSDMKITLNIDGSVIAKLKYAAQRRGCTISELVESALRLSLETKKDTRKLPRLPTFDSGGELVDIANRTTLYKTMKNG
jgi:hypothetical protein